MVKLFVFDLDGTLCNLDHRLHLLKDKKHQDWRGFHLACANDEPIQWVIDLLNIVRHHGEVLLLSGRTDAVENETREWLKKYGVIYDYLVMRPDKDYRPDEIIKLEMLDNFLRDKDFKVQFIVDDRQKVVDMWRANGYHVLQCNAWKE